MVDPGQPPVAPDDGSDVDLLVSFPLDPATMRPAYHWYWRQLRFGNWYRPLVGAIALGLALHFLRNDTQFALRAGLFTIAVLLLPDYWLGRWKFLRSLRHTPNFGKETTIRLTPEQVTVTAEGVKSELAWMHFLKTRTTPDGLLLFVRKNQFFWLPASAFATPDDFQRASQLLASRTTHDFVG